MKNQIKLKEYRINRIILIDQLSCIAIFYNSYNVYSKTCFSAISSKGDNLRGFHTDYNVRGTLAKMGLLLTPSSKVLLSFKS